MYNRITEWEKFNNQMERHIEEYTKAQYGNPSGNEQVENFTVEECAKNIERYLNRRNSRVRGNKEALRDWLKVAHYAQFIYGKLKEELKEKDVY